MLTEDERRQFREHQLALGKTTDALERLRARARAVVAALRGIVNRYHREGWIGYEELEALAKQLEAECSE